MSNLIGIWLLLQGMCVLAGWTLSMLGQLNAVGYLVFFGVTGGAVALWGKRWWQGTLGGRLKLARQDWSRYARRFRRVFPMLFLLAALGAFLGGALYAPNNYDALTYRLPRVLMWWDHSAWHWIHTAVPPMNYSAVGFEWLMMPMLVLTHSDRLLFLINIAGFLLMPGLLYSVLAGAGVAARVAWAWMWLLPMGFCYIMQAGSIGNDALAACYVLAAIHFAFRARKSGRVEHLCLAFLAAGLATGDKVLNLPLLLPIAVAVWPALGLLRSRLVFGVVMLLFSAVVSFGPSAVLNTIYTGHWGGDPANIMQAQIKKPLAGIVGNSLQMAEGMVAPPIFPYARNVSGWMADHAPDHLMDLLKRDFPRFIWGFGELPQEEASGLGLGITVLLAAVFLRWRKGWPVVDPARRAVGKWIGITAWLALIVYMTKAGSEATSRLVAAYYPLLVLPILRMRGQTGLVRRPCWKILGLLSTAATLLALVLTPLRPLWPAGRVCDWLAMEFPHNSEIVRAQRVYSVYRKRNSFLAPVRRHIPNEVLTFGVIEEMGGAETSLWQPYGRRRVRELVGIDLWRPPDMEWVAVRQQALEEAIGKPFDWWVRRTGGTVVAREMIASTASGGEDAWYVVHFAGAQSKHN